MGHSGTAWPKTLWALLALALLLRLGWGLTRPADLSPLPDQIEYLKLGTSLLAGDGLSLADERYALPLRAYRTPGYPVFVAACGANVTLVRLAQAVLDTSTVLAVFLLARRLGLGRAALLAAGFVALHPFLIHFTSLLLTETLFTAMLAWGVLLLMSGGSRVAVAGAAVLALTVLVRPGAIALPACLSILAAITRDRTSRLPLPFITGLLTLLVLLPWAWRNHRVLGEWIWTTTNAGITAYDGFNPAADGSSNHAAFLLHYAEVPDLTETQRNAYFAELAAGWRAGNPDRVYRLMLTKLGRTWSPVPLAEANQTAVALVSGLLLCGTMMLLALLGLARGGLSPGRKALLLLPAVYVSVAAMMSVGSMRYRLPADPMLAILAAVGSASLRTRTVTPQPIDPPPPPPSTPHPAQGV
jgi:4-amino-4-deoxy-L-arabinose transferase-like glycosyltransferase